MPPKLTLYKERPPSVQGATNITVAEVGGFTPIRNVTFSVRARSCPDGANATCERYARAVSPISPLLLVDKGGRASVPVQMSFDFSDPRGDYAMGVAIDAANDARAREERLLELEIIPPSCRKARDDIKLVGAEFYLAKKALRDFLAPCDEWSKTDPVKAAKASSLVSAFIVFSTNIAVLKGQVAGHNVSSVKVLSVLRSSERNLDGLCVGIEGSEPLCEMANATLRGTLREVGGYYCSNGTTRSELLRRNGAIANVFLSPLGLRCAALTALDRVAARYEEALALRAQAQAARIVPPRALGRYPEVVQRLEEARRGYDELGLSEDASRVAGELGSVERERIELERLWTALLRVAAALAALATLILCGMYTQYRLKTRKVLEL
jgi:hypothetical protein